MASGAGTGNGDPIRSVTMVRGMGPQPTDGGLAVVNGGGKGSLVRQAILGYNANVTSLGESLTEWSEEPGAPILPASTEEHDDCGERPGMLGGLV